MHAMNSTLADMTDAEVKTFKAQRIRAEQGLDMTLGIVHNLLLLSDFFLPNPVDIKARN